jgi:hypothetical protein
MLGPPAKRSTPPTSTSPETVPASVAASPLTSPGASGSTPSPGAPPAGHSPSTPPTSCACSTAPFGDGTYVVGRDIAAGAWLTGGAVNVALKVCSFSINGGRPKQVVVSVGTTTVHLRAGDVFVTSGCQPWRRV